jgi:ankyrin repeat protein
MDRPSYYEPTPGEGGMTNLMHCARWGFVGPLKRELKNGADVNAQDQSGFTALIWNCRMGNNREYRRRRRIFRILAKAGASMSVMDKAGKDVLATAKYFAPRPLSRFVVKEFARMRKQWK